MKRAVIYTRVSSEEQANGYSLTEQESEVRQLCEFKGWEVVRVYSDTNLSDQITKRLGFQQMMADAEAGQVDVIVVRKLDRFSRNLVDTITYLGRLEQVDVSFISATEDFDFTTPMGKLMLSMLGVFAEWYVNNLVIETPEDLATAVLPDEWRAAVNVLLEALRHRANGTTTEADDDLLNLVESMTAGQPGQPHENGVITGSLAG